MMMLDGRVAVISGAAQGLGREFTESLLKNGAKVALLDVNETAGRELHAYLVELYGEDKAQFYSCDVASDEQFKDVFQKTIKKFGRVDIVCNNAGILNEKSWEKAVSINLSGVVRGSYLALDYMNKDNGGQGGVIVNVASLAGLGPLVSAPVYTATKHGVVGFTRALAAASDVGGYGVRINALCPSFVRTALLNSFQSEEKTGQFFKLKAVSESLLEKFPVLDVEEVTKAFLFLVKDESLNGAVLSVRKEGATLVSFPKEVAGTPVTL